MFGACCTGGENDDVLKGDLIQKKTECTSATNNNDFS